MPEISVLMPVYNASRFLREAIDSILLQTLTDFEFIIIDDCSTDDSVDIINTYNDGRIRFFRNEKNGGISYTLNRGIELADTKWIARMDADDISYPQRLQRQHDFILQQNEGDLFSCWVKVVDQDKKFIRQDLFESRFYYYNLYFICWIYHPSVIFSKAAAIAVGGYTMRYSEDFELFWQLTRKYKFYNQPEVLMDYRVTDQSLHQVLRKKEYEETQHNILTRNFKWLAGEDYEVAPEYLDCLQHNFEPLLKKKSGYLVAECIKHLRFLSEKIIAKENINSNHDDLNAAAFYKQRFIINFFLKHLPKPESIKLLYYLGQYKKAVKSIFKKHATIT
jgi:glycosyltransferase involved in cell wall biosynthesis